MRIFGVIGSPIGHSFSPNYFKTKFVKEHIDAEYHAYELKDISKIRKLIESENLKGINVTLPHKSTIIQYIDGIEPAAAEINAVNVVKIEDQKLIGYNTDWSGFADSLTPLISKESRALIFGTGGSSQAVKYALSKMGISYSLVSRRPDIGYNYAEITAEVLKDFNLLINTTPLGLSPKINQCPEIDYSGITKQHLCYDLVYNPEKTLFLQKAEAQGAVIKNGHEMLVRQADRTWDIWN